MLYVRFHGVGWAASSVGKGPVFLLNENVYVEAVTAQPGNPDNGGCPKSGRNKQRDRLVLFTFAKASVRNSEKTNTAE